MTEDYWKKLDLLCAELELEGNQNLASELRDARSYVNGLTDGWHDFLDAFEKIIAMHKLKEQTKQLATTLIETLKYRLKKR